MIFSIHLFAKLIFERKIGLLFIIIYLSPSTKELKERTKPATLHKLRFWKSRDRNGILAYKQQRKVELVFTFWDGGGGGGGGL